MLIGATSAGPTGGEVLGALAVAVPVAMLSQMIYAYPTFHRAIEDAITCRVAPEACQRSSFVITTATRWNCSPSRRGVSRENGASRTAPAPFN
jgi:hypothetical protein